MAAILLTDEQRYVVTYVPTHFKYQKKCGFPYDGSYLYHSIICRAASKLINNNILEKNVEKKTKSKKELITTPK